MIVEQCLITPSCGLGSVSVEMAKKALGLVREISGEFKKIKEGEIWQEK
jgi:methionine synthase II (cobalamin-independent)